MGTDYDEKRIAFITHEVAEAIDQASFGKLPWTVATEIFSAAFPGGYAALVNQDFIHDSVNFLEWSNIENRFISSYIEHFAFLNPWADIFTRMPSGSVCIAEKHLPARTFSDTEFYNDWLLPQGDVLGGVGLKVDASPTDVIMFPVHYPGRFTDIYDEPAAEVSRRLVGVIKRATSIAHDFQREREEVASKATVTSRFWPAVVVDSTMRLCNANSEAEALLSGESILRCRRGKVQFADSVLSQRVATAVASLAASVASDISSCSWHDPQNPMVIFLSRLPKTHPMTKPLISERTQILLLIKRLAHRPAPPDLAAFGEAFGLARSEVLLCLSLYAGHSLQEAAIELGLTYETVRTRTKSIFQKTGVRGQPALCALLATYAG